MKYTLIFISLLLSACATTSVDKPISVVTPTSIPIDSKFFEECSLLEVLPPSVTADDIAKIHFIKVIELYGDCANKQQASIELIKRLGNIKAQ